MTLPKADCCFTFKSLVIKRSSPSKTKTGVAKPKMKIAYSVCKTDIAERDK